jgi:hypothetical protein
MNGKNIFRAVGLFLLSIGVPYQSDELRYPCVGDSSLDLGRTISSVKRQIRLCGDSDPSRVLKCGLNR